MLWPHLVSVRRLQEVLSFPTAARDPLESLRQSLFDFLLFGGKAAARITSSFVRSVPSEQWIYGCRNGDLFARGFDDHDTFAEHLRDLERDMEAEVRVQGASRVEALLSDVASGLFRHR